MKTKRMIILTIILLTVALLSTTGSANQTNDPDFNEIGCTIVAVGKDATVNGTAMITHNDDSSVADYRLWIKPALDWPEGSMRDLVVDGHNYVDYINWPEVDYGDNAFVMAQIPEVEHTYAYFHSRYSFMNEMGVAMGESTFGINRSFPQGEEKRRIMQTDSTGIVDCWLAQDIALERATTAREAVRIMGDLIEEFKWIDQGGETINITDGEEVWIMEAYGLDIWCAVRIPNDHFFVAANRARIRDIDLDDKENVMYSPKLVSFAVEQGWYDPDSGEPFRPADVYAPDDGLYSTRREWRALKLVAPSLDIHPDDIYFPLSVKPEKKLSVHDIFKIKGDYYKGTDYDISTGPAAGPFGDPLKYPNTPGHNERAINIMRTCYVHIAEVDPELPPPFKGISWYGYGAPDTSYIVPLWPAMNELPEGYRIGTRYEPLDRDSYWWTNTYVQEMTQFKYNEAIEELYKFRDPKLESLYKITPVVQKAATELYKTDQEAAIKMISDFAYGNAVRWHDEWLALGDSLFSMYWTLNTRSVPEWFDKVSVQWAAENMPKIGRRESESPLEEHPILCE